MKDEKFVSLAHLHVLHARHAWCVQVEMNGSVQVWEVSSKKLKLDLPGHADEVFTVDWSPDGSSVASGGKDQVLRIWRQ
jgi:WD40 repeat protein